ncbi:CHC2 zinc finger domain-containing protein [Patescibacteria group bacterium]
MNKNLEKILQVIGIDEFLEDLIQTKVKYYLDLKETLISLYELVLSHDLDPLEQMFYEQLVHYLYGGDEIEMLQREINKLCSYLKRISTIEESKKIYKKDWQRIIEELEIISVVGVIGQYTEIKNPNFLVKCPLHDDKTPSLKIYQQTNSWYCFGCQKGGMPVNFLMYMENLDFKTAAKKLLNH